MSEKVRGMSQAWGVALVGVHSSAVFLLSLSFLACWLDLVV